MSSPTDPPEREAPLPRVPVVLLCAEDDDLDLISFVHTARQRGLEPEVVTGVDDDDGPLLEAIAINGAALFVALRSDNLDQGRTLALKRLFARHAKKKQKLLALRLEPARAQHVVQTIARRLRAFDLEPSTPKRSKPTTPRPSPSTASRQPSVEEEREARWDEKTVIADHLPRPPRDLIDERTKEADEQWDDETVVADHLPRPPEDSQDVAEAEETTEVLPDAPEEQTKAETLLRRGVSIPVVTVHEAPPSASTDDTHETRAPSRPQSRSTNTGLWFALLLLVLAAWKTGPMVLASCAPPPAETEGPSASDGR